MNLDNYNIPAHVKVTATEKKYFNKYAFRVEFTVDKSLLIPNAKQNGRGWRINNNWTNFKEIKEQLTSALVRAFAEVEKTLGSEVDCRLRSEGYVINVYFAEIEILDIFISTPDLAPLIKQITAPINKQHLTSLQDSKVIRFRKSLFLRKYTYKVYLKPGFAISAAERGKINSWLDETYSNDKERVELNPQLRRHLVDALSSRYWSSRYVIYFTDETDLMMCQLRLNEHISLVEHAVLLSNLEVLAE